MIPAEISRIADESLRHVLKGFAEAAQAIARNTDNPVVDVAGRTGAVLFQLLIRIMADRGVEEALEILTKIDTDGAEPISRVELDDQVERVLAELRAKG